MKVNHSKPPSGADIVRLQKAGKNQACRSAATPTVADKVDLSGRAGEIQDIVNVARSLPEVRTEKVAGIRNQIDSGSYVVDPLKVARKMIDEIV